MAKWWREPLDPTRHSDHFRVGGAISREPPADPLVPAFAYFVRVAGATFEFADLGQLADCLGHFERPLLGSSREVVFEPEKGHWQHWFQRVPLFLREEPRRLKVVKALTAALSEFRRT